MDAGIRKQSVRSVGKRLNKKRKARLATGFSHLDIKICYETKIFFVYVFGPFYPMVKEQSDLSD